MNNHRFALFEFILLSGISSEPQEALLQITESIPPSLQIYSSSGKLLVTSRIDRSFNMI